MADSPASFEKVNDYFRVMDEAIGKLNEEKGDDAASPYELFLAIKCLEYKFDTHQMNAYFRQTLDALQKIDDKKKQDYYR